MIKSNQYPESLVEMATDEKSKTRLRNLILAEQYRIVIVEYRVFNCPYCNIEIKTDHINSCTCANCNQSILFFDRPQKLEHYINEQEWKQKLDETDDPIAEDFFKRNRKGVLGTWDEYQKNR